MAKPGVPGMTAKGSASPSATLCLPRQERCVYGSGWTAHAQGQLRIQINGMNISIRYIRSDILKIPRLLKKQCEHSVQLPGKTKGGWANHPRFYTWPLSRSFFTRIDSPGLGCTNETCCSSMVSCSICPLFSLRVISEGSALWNERVASAR